MCVCIYVYIFGLKGPIDTEEMSRYIGGLINYKGRKYSKRGATKKTPKERQIPVTQ